MTDVKTGVSCPLSHPQVSCGGAGPNVGVLAQGMDRRRTREVTALKPLSA
ncbi:hypothetical protein [Mycobacterium sp. 852002-53434_SCH5985345]|nr:hypothetical protein [Mycobacterium sp. 852002-53434_SCH5985345]